jgi:hypothetical protein
MAILDGVRQSESATGERVAQNHGELRKATSLKGFFSLDRGGAFV